MAFFAANFIATTGRSRSAPLHVQAGFLPVQTKTHAKARRTLWLIGGTNQLPGRAVEAEAWYGELLTAQQANVESWPT